MSAVREYKAYPVGSAPAEEKMPIKEDRKAMGDKHREQSITLEEIKSIVELVRSNEVSEFKLERGEEKIWLKRGTDTVVVSHPAAPLQQQHQQVHPAQQQYAAPPTNSPTPSLSVVDGQGALSSPPPPQAVGKTINSPMVGTFYRRPAVDAAPYVEVGDIVKKGDVLCIVEAMKLMNEIEADASGRILEICLEDGQMVEYGEPLFRIEPS